MDFMIFDISGNAVAAFADAVEAANALRAMVVEDPDAVRELALFAFDEDGNAVGDVVVGADVAPDYAGEITLAGEQWAQSNAETFVEIWFRTFSDVMRPSGAAAAAAA